ncbi:hypothetical protein A1O3_04124 [Capronia epimyces CBS 606.96]|uniref:AB hydrolase-1 domain-containing protein n=1 Tax=Capronia epimyces CBS 606.96 TaxID=1182542 RepID=W9YBW0_9EURO|nr:uncharacterized protein A1O3_04124 [Capronia epimyces CBS 606.96]EXJ87165.1 hypothetical protein A1O3_04124 [Capronia epimyces CBS 606.96]
MIRLSSDDSVHFELLRILGLSRYFGADVGEVLQAAAQIQAEDLTSVCRVFHKLATRVNGQAEQIDASKYPVSARDAYFRAATYFRSADIYLHTSNDASDPLSDELWEKQRLAFDKAIALLPIPGERLLLKADGFDVAAIYYRSTVGDRSTPKPALIIGPGYDGSHEEMLHAIGFAALERGYNVLTYEGPGQPTVRRDQGLGFIVEWERVVTPVVDYLYRQPDVDSSRIGLIGVSMGGWLAVRAAAFEHRLAAAMAIDGVYDFYQAAASHFPPPVRALLDSGDFQALDSHLGEFLASGMAPTAVSWGIGQGLWSFNVASPGELVAKMKGMTLKGIEDKVQCPVWVGEASEDQFTKGQPEQVRDALGDKATYVRLTAEDAAGYHCHEGAAVLMNQRVLDWFGDIISKR